MNPNLIWLLIVLGLAAIGFGAYFIPRLIQKRKDTQFLDGLATPSNDGADASVCVVGPFVRGVNWSAGVPAKPTPLPGGGWSLEMPVPTNAAILSGPNTCDKHVHSVTFNPGSLAGKKAVRMKGRWDIPAGVELKPKTDPALPSIMCVWIQRQGDDWNGIDATETYRWYWTAGTMSPIVAGDFDWTIPLDEAAFSVPPGNGWTAVETSSQKNNPAAFQAALANCASLGIGLGGGDGNMHGLFATGAGAVLTVTEFRAE